MTALDATARSTTLAAILPLAVALLSAGCDSERATRARREAALQTFTTYCSACHQPDGKGTPGGAPPLAGSPWVTGSEERLVRILLHGLHGKVEVHGVTYDLQMPAFGPIFSDEKVADVLSFVRERFGPGSPPIDAATVARIRAAVGPRTFYWTAEELLKLP